MEPRLWVKEITFSGGSTITLRDDDVVLIVGPNNAGKSATLRFIRDGLENKAAKSPVVTGIRAERQGDVNEFISWLEQIARADLGTNGRLFSALGVQMLEQNARAWWSTGAGSLHVVRRLFCHMLTADERLQVANPAQNIALTRQAPTHPIHYLQRDDELERKLSAQFREAFDVDLVVHRNAGTEVPLYCGERPIPREGEDRVSVGYLAELERLAPLKDQGDGMRSFAGVLLHTSVGRESILLIDEPEAFLHPPQARFLGRVLARDQRTDRQLFIATHSGDVLRGMLDAAGPRLRIIRLQRTGQTNIAHELAAEDIAAYWSDPLLRYSNILDGIFHEKVVLCESDSDSRFYAAVMESIDDPTDPARRRVDFMFAHCGGKARLPMAIRALRHLGVPVAAVADFDVLSEERPLRDMVEALGLAWEEVEADWRLVKKSIEEKKAELSIDEVRAEISKILDGVDGKTLPNSAKQAISAALRRSSPWSTAKAVGKAFVPSGDPSLAIERLLNSLRAAGLFVVEVGELEGFVRTVGNHGPAWVNQVLQRDLRADAELETARQFVRTLIASP